MVIFRAEAGLVSRGDSPPVSRSSAGDATAPNESRGETQYLRAAAEQEVPLEVACALVWRAISDHHGPVRLGVRFVSIERRFERLGVHERLFGALCLFEGRFVVDRFGCPGKVVDLVPATLVGFGVRRETSAAQVLCSRNPRLFCEQFRGQ